MARNTKYVTIDDEKSRDYGKMFFLTEKSAFDAEKWARRALRGMKKAGFEIDEKNDNLQSLVMYGLDAFLSIDDETLDPLLDQMLECVEIVPDKKAPQTKRPLFKDDAFIEEVSTLIKLRYEVIMLHISFFTNGGHPNTAK